MPVLTSRISILTATPANAPLAIDLVSQASAIQEILIWTSSTATVDKFGWRLYNRKGTLIVPNMGSHDSFAFGAGEDGWAPIPTSPKSIPMNDQVIEGPPYVLQFQFYNNDAAAVLVGLFVVVREPFAVLAQNAMLYEFLTSKGAPVSDVSPETRTPLTSEKKDGRLSRTVQGLLAPRAPQPREHLGK